MKTSCPHLPSSEAQIHSRSLSLLPSQWGTANGGYGQFTSSLLLLPHSEESLSSLLPCSSKGSLPQSSINFSHMSPSHKLQILMNCLCRSLPQDAFIQEQAAPGKGIHGLVVGVSSPMDSMGYRGRAVSSWSSPQPARESLLECLNTFSSFLFTSLGVSSIDPLIYSHSFPLSAVTQGFFPLLKSVIPSSLMGLVFASDESVLELAGISFIRYQGRLWQLVRETTPVAPTTKTLPYKPNIT